jgi:LysR family nitrogen assimilation transcriptional regulator
MTLKLQQLRYFVQVAECGSFTRAATKLNLAQPALSRQIRLLEDDLGVPLFRRDGRGVEPTAAGVELMQRANALFAELYEMRQSVMAYRGTADGDVTIGILPLFGATVVPALLLRAREAHPHVTIKLMVGMSDAIHEWTVAGRIDFGVVSTAAETSTYLVAREIAQDRLYLVTAAASAPVPAGTPITLADALGRPLVIPTKSNGIRAVIDRYVRQGGLAVTPAFEVDSIEIIKRLVPTGIGGTILPGFSVVNEVASGLFTVNPIIEPELDYKVDLTFPIDRPLSRNAAAIAEILSAVASETVGRNAGL